MGLEELENRETCTWLSGLGGGDKHRARLTEAPGTEPHPSAVKSRPSEVPGQTDRGLAQKTLGGRPDGMEGISVNASNRHMKIKDNCFPFLESPLIFQHLGGPQI